MEEVSISLNDGLLLFGDDGSNISPVYHLTSILEEETGVIHVTLLPTVHLPDCRVLLTRAAEDEIQRWISTKEKKPRRLWNMKIRSRTSDERPYECGQCNYKARYLSRLKRHMMSHTGEKPYKCDTCDFRTAQQSDQFRHARTHTGDRPYACDTCDFAARQRSHLKTHKLLHTGERPFPCNVCEYRSREPNALRKHMRTHTGEKPYACHVCDYKTAEQGNLKRHVRLNHSGRISFSE